MKLSIVIPVYRVEATLDRCVESVLAQDIDEMEVILVDDGSPDQCPQQCDGWAQREKRIRVVHKANGGLSDARNAGIEAATGDYITFVDSDDFLAPDTYGPLMEALARNPQVDLLEYPIFRYYGAKEEQVIGFEERLYEDKKAYWLEANAYLHTYACNKIFRSTLFKNVRFPEGVVFEDAATLPSLLLNARQIMTCGKGLYYYCYNSKGITATADGKQLDMLLQHHLKAMKHYCDTLYYMHVVNIQLDVCRLLSIPSVMPRFPIDLHDPRLSSTQRLKAVILKFLGMKALVKLHRLKP